MSSDFYRRALIRNFFAFLFREGEDYLAVVKEEEANRVCSADDKELLELASTTAEFVVGITMSDSEISQKVAKVREWCNSLQSSSDHGEK
jgi:hypothetical protein